MRASDKGSRSSKPNVSKVLTALILLSICIGSTELWKTCGAVEREARSPGNEAALKRAGLKAARPGTGCCGLHALVREGGSSCAREA